MISINHSKYSINQKRSTNDYLSIYSDGGARGNPGPAACAFVVKDPRGKIIHQQGKYLSHATNNVAEYNGVIEALNWLINNARSSQISQYTDIHFFLDSLLITNQLNGLFRIKNNKLRELILEVKGLENQLPHKIYYQHIPREKNFEADRVVNEALDKIDQR